MSVSILAYPAKCDLMCFHVHIRHIFMCQQEPNPSLLHDHLNDNHYVMKQTSNPSVLPKNVLSCSIFHKGNALFLRKCS